MVKSIKLRFVEPTVIRELAHMFLRLNKMTVFSYRGKVKVGCLHQLWCLTGHYQICFWTYHLLHSDSPELHLSVFSNTFLKTTLSAATAKCVSQFRQKFSFLTILNIFSSCWLDIRLKDLTLLNTFFFFRLAIAKCFKFLQSQSLMKNYDMKR